MPVKILDKPVIHEKCRTSQQYASHRLRLYNSYSWYHHRTEDKYFQGLREVTKDRNVVEIGCGIFGGLSSMVLDMGCASYTGIDSSIGDKTKRVNKEDHKTGEIDYWTMIPYVISIPEDVKNDGRANFIFGKDFLTFLEEEVKDNSVVTISTGFFDKSEILMPRNHGQDYVLEGMEQIARVTIKGYPVGMHHLFPDEYPSEDVTAGKFFKENFLRFGIHVVPICMGERDPFCLLMKE